MMNKLELAPQKELDELDHWLIARKLENFNTCIRDEGINSLKDLNTLTQNEFDILVQTLVSKMNMKRFVTKKFKLGWEELKEAGLDDIARSFLRHDRDGSGMVKKNKIKPMLRMLNIKFTNNHLHQVMEDVDKSGDGLFSLDQYRNIVKKIKNGPIKDDLKKHIQNDDKDIISFLFQKYDKKGNGFINVSNIYEICNKLNLHTQTIISDFIQKKEKNINEPRLRLLIEKMKESPIRQIDELDEWLSANQMSKFSEEIRSNGIQNLSDLTKFSTNDINTLLQDLQTHSGMKKLQAKKFQLAFDELLEAGLDEVARVFRRNDKDGTGTVNIHQIANMLRQLNLKYPRKMIDNVVNEANESMDNLFSLNEFREILVQLEVAHKITDDDVSEIESPNDIIAFVFKKYCEDKNYVSWDDISNMIYELRLSYKIDHINKVRKDMENQENLTESTFRDFLDKLKETSIAIPNELDEWLMKNKLSKFSSVFHEERILDISTLHSLSPIDVDIL